MANQGIVTTAGKLGGLDLSSLSDNTSITFRGFFKLDPVTAPPPTPNFYVGQQILAPGRPTNATFEANWGLRPTPIHYGRDFWPDQSSPYNPVLPLQSVVEGLAQEVGTHPYAVLDIEDYPGFWLYSTAAEKEDWDADGSTINGWFSAALQDSSATKFGWYMMPMRVSQFAPLMTQYFINPGHGDVVFYKQEMDRYDRIWGSQTCSVPSGYMLYSYGWPEYLNMLDVLAAESKRNSPNNPVIMYLWPQFHHSVGDPRTYEYVDGVFWRQALDHCYNHPDIDGLVIWGIYYAYVPDGETSDYTNWSRASTFDWWAETVDFMSVVNAGAGGGGATNIGSEHIIESSSPGYHFSININDRNYIRVSLNSPTTYYFDSINGIFDDPIVNKNGWNEIFVSIDTTTLTQHLYINGVDKIGTVHVQTQDTPVQWSGFTNVTLGGDPGTTAVDENITGAIQECWLARHFVDPATFAPLFSPGGDPADLGSDNSGRTGAQPEVYVNGDPDAGTAQLNLGAFGGQFTIYGTLTGSGDIPDYDPGTAPTDPPTQLHLGMARVIGDSIDALLLAGTTNMTYARSSVVTVFDQTEPDITGELDAFLYSAPANAPAFDRDPAQFGNPLGLLFETSRTNYCLASKDISDGAWVNVGLETKAAANATGLDNELTAGTITASAVGDYLQQDATVPVGADLCFAMDVQNVDSATCRIEIRSGTSTNIGRIDFTWSGAALTSATASTGTGGSIELRDGWYRVWISGTMQGADTDCRILIYPNRDGVSDLGVNIDEMQLEDALRPTSRIRTTTTSVTRAAPTLTTADVDWYSNSQAGTAIITFRAQDATADGRTLFEFADVSDARVIAIEQDADTTFNAVYGGTGSLSPTETAAFGLTHSVGITWDTNSFKIYLNGALIAEDTSLTLAAGVTQLFIGSKVDGTQHLDGWVETFYYENAQQTDSYMIAFTGTDRTYVSFAMTAILQGTFTQTFSADAHLAKTTGLTASLDSRVTRQALLRTVSADAILGRAGITISTNMDASVVPTGTSVLQKTASLDSVLTGGLQTGLATMSMDAIVRPGWGQLEDASGDLWSAINSFKGT
jgi:hypothetical protein